MFTKNINSAATTNGQNITRRGTKIHAIQVFNAGAGAAFLKIYDKATAPVVGTDTPVQVYQIPAASNGLGYTGAFPLQLTTGLSIAITGAAADSDATAVAANQVKATISYG